MLKYTIMLNISEVKCAFKIINRWLFAMAKAIVHITGVEAQDAE